MSDHDTELVFCGLTLDCAGGIAGITRRVLHAIETRAPDCRYTVLIPETQGALRRDLEIPDHRIEFVPGRSPTRHPLGTTIWWQNRHAAYARRRYPRALFVSFSDFWSAVRPARTVVLLHDALNERRPHDASRPLSPRRVWRRLCNRWAARADVVLTVSAASARDLASFRHIPAQKLTVTHPWLDERMTRPPDSASRAAARAAYRLPPAYSLCLTNFRLHKNIPRLLEGYRQLRAEGFTTPLVLAGALPYAPAATRCCDPAVEIARLGLTRDAVHLPGAIAAAHLPALLAECELFVFPSLLEGFGFPPLEASSVGAPVIGARATSVPEVIGEDRACFDPEDTATLVQAWKRAAAKPDEFRRPFDPFWSEEQGLLRWLGALERGLGVAGRFTHCLT